MRLATEEQNAVHSAVAQTNTDGQVQLSHKLGERKFNIAVYPDTTRSIQQDDDARESAPVTRETIKMGQMLGIQCQKKVFESVLPAKVSGGFQLDQLDAVLDRGPQLSAPERQAMAKDLGELRGNLANR